MSDTTTNTLMQIAERSALALEAAIKEHGPDAVGLAMTVFQLSAIKDLVMAILILIPAYYAPRIWRAVNDWVSEGDRFSDRGFGATVFGGTAATFYGVVVLVEALSRIFDPFLWMAAFGRPEALIAKRALEAAGLY